MKLLMKFVIILLLCSGIVHAENIQNQTVVGAHMYYTRLNFVHGIGTEVEAKGKYNIPTINPAEFEIIDFKIEMLSIAAASGWSNHINGWSHSYITHYLSLGEGGNEIENTHSSNYKDEWGSMHTLHAHTSIFGLSVFAKDKLYSNENTPLELHFLLSAGSGGTSGSACYIYWGFPTVTYTLRRIDADAALPPSHVGSFMRNEMRHMDNHDGSDRVHPSLFEDPEFNIPGIMAEVPAVWTFPSPKSVSCEIWGFPGYRYTLMKGDTPGTGEPLTSVDGAGSTFTLSHDDTNSSDTRAFFWVMEEKIE